MTSTNTLGIRNGNQIIPYGATTKQTKEVALTVTSAQAGWSTIRVVGIAYADSAGVWRLRFNISAAYISLGAGSVSIVCTISGAVFKAGQNQAVVASAVGNTPQYRAYCNDGASTINVNMIDGNATTGVNISGDVELNAEPTTYTTAANMEGAVNASVYIPPASAGVVGLVNNAVANTAGTPILGKTDGVAVGTGYVGQRITWATPPSGQTGYTNNSYADWTNATLVLPAGEWAVYANICTSVDTSGVDGMTVQILDATNSNTLVAGMRKDVAFIPGIGASYIPFAFRTSLASSTTYKIQACLRHFSGTTTSVGTYNDDRLFSEFYAIRTA